MINLKNIIAVVQTVALLSVSLNSFASNKVIVDYNLIIKNIKIKQDTGRSTFLLPKNSIYLELIGQSIGIYSVNYERCILSIEKKSLSSRGLSFRLGGSYYKFSYYKDSKLFCTFNYHNIFSKSVQFEIGFGSGYGKSINYLSKGTYFSGFYGVVNSGFRFIILRKMYLRANINLIYKGGNKTDLNPIWFYPDYVLPGLSLGITF